MNTQVANLPVDQQTLIIAASYLHHIRGYSKSEAIQEVGKRGIVLLALGNHDCVFCAGESYALAAFDPQEGEQTRTEPIITYYICVGCANSTVTDPYTVESAKQHLQKLARKVYGQSPSAPATKA